MGIKRMAQDQVFAIARKTLNDLATVSLEERVGEVFTRRLRQMDAKGKEELGAALKASPEASLVRSAFELPADQKDAIQNALNETFSSVIRVRYETDANAISGIEITANGQKLAWSISSYLDAFGQSLEKMLELQNGTESGSSSEPAPSTPSAPVVK
jgi:F-type H+-transporting ATPase subunit b